MGVISLKFANENKIAVVPQGGNTSLCGAATPDDSGTSFVVSFEKMNKVRQFNKESQTITVESGVILSHIHDVVEKENLFFPLSLGAQGSCMIGGNLSTNAGGVAIILDGDSRHLYIYKLDDFDQNPFPLLRTFEFDKQHPPYLHPKSIILN